jgi:hypothetical protein
MNAEKILRLIQSVESLLFPVLLPSNQQRCSSKESDQLALI